MSRIEIGPCVLMVPDGVEREVEVTDFGGQVQLAQETPAVVAGPGGLLMELAHRRWKFGGQVVAMGRGDSAPVFDRLLHGVRLGIKGLDDGTDFCEVDLLRWDPAKNWGNVSMTPVTELDAVLGTSVDALMVEAGSLGFGSRGGVLGDTSKRRNRLCATFPAHEALGPLTVYVLTRVLPIVAAEQVTS